MLAKYLEGYDKVKTDTLLNGFTNGFSLGFEGEKQAFTSPNLKSALEMPSEVDRKLAKELSLGRLAGPFQSPPLSNFRTSPIGLVPKKVKNTYRVIHHLSYPKGSSVNDGIPFHKSTVNYATVDDAIAMIKRVGPGCYLAKTDIESAFSLLPVDPTDYNLLGFQWNSEFYYSKVMPMGGSSSCQTFESFSTSLEWIAKNKLNIPNVLHILDDFLFIVKAKSKCQKAVDDFSEFCHISGIPLVLAKTEGPATELPFAGIELDTVRMEARLPPDKIAKCRNQLNLFLKSKKVKLVEIQALIGLLNFACTVVRPGRPFLRRLIDLTIGLKYPAHRRRLTKEVKQDLLVWSTFLDNYNGRSFFISDYFMSSSTLHFYSDASTSHGWGVIFQSHWSYGEWNLEYKSWNIAILEFYPIVLAVYLWGSVLVNKSVVFHTDNEALVHVINKQTCKDPKLMLLLRRLVLKCLELNVVFTAVHIPGLKNIYADSLSRLQIDKFRNASSKLNMDLHPTPLEPAMRHESFFQPLKRC